MSLRAFVESEAIYDFQILTGKFAKTLTLNFNFVDCFGDKSPRNDTDYGVWFCHASNAHSR
ncbi:hypothetical protein OFO01_03760 [Campylobacter sp. JMF_01 NE2]|uniref:hypothetical protein n=1 Tax=unclassified Campylobacter TaxID=2593542 RepID=UPI0022E9A4D3|nr:MULTISPECIES: hypothetical protein [unclassified Campylobacter]MDA3052562.1 hypothetical protein [Campylobacter sp. JMF_03 NE3]MDA3066894.1 hypothetical protein [Campylobacter sp. JMF_01 NE2]